jgi:hypothetical protein
MPSLAEHNGGGSRPLSRPALEDLEILARCDHMAFRDINYSRRAKFVSEGLATEISVPLSAEQSVYPSYSAIRITKEGIERVEKWVADGRP